VSQSAFEAAKDRILREGEINGGLTVRSLFDLMVASHADSMTWEVHISDQLSSHLDDVPHMDHEAFKRFIADRDEKLSAAARDVLVEADRRCVALRACKPRAPRRSGDPPDVSYVEGETVEDGDMKRAWRIARWAGVVFGAASIVALADVVVRLIFGT